jgi:hypothetical protein
VYIPTFKNASSTYSQFFSQLGWSNWSIDYLDWDGDIIFSHISDPYERHIKGIVEYLRKTGLMEYIDDPKFLKLVSAGFFDHHTYPLHMMLGEKMSKIFWIPIDHPKISGDQLTCMFLKKFDIVIDPNHITKVHQADKKILEIRKTIKAQCEQNNYRGDNQMFALNFDNMVYQETLSKFNNWV